MRLIDGDAFAEDVDKIPEGGYLSPHDLISLINARPTIEERKKGKWIEPKPDGCWHYDAKAYAECSICGKVQFLGNRMNYCPNCGARMSE